MRILMLRNAASHLRCELKEGDSGVVSRDLGERLIGLGIAESIEEAKPARARQSTVKGVSPKPSIAEVKPAEIAGDDKTESESDSKESAE